MSVRALITGASGFVGRHLVAAVTGDEIEEIAFPAISCGAYRYPILEATRIAVGETLAFLAESPVPRRVQFCCFGSQVQRAYDRALAEAARGEL